MVRNDKERTTMITVKKIATEIRPVFCDHPVT
jgi:hypothetical protein